MKAAAHIVFKFKKDRIAYLQSIIKEFEKYPFFVDVFIHSDKKLDTNLTFDQYSNGKIILKKLNLRKYFIYKGWKYRLAFSARKLLAKQKDEYDIFIYLEDDILIPKEAIDYWLTYKDLCISQNYNLGFLRVEKKNGEEYLTDLTIKLNKTLKIDDNKFIINDKSPYSAFWIYDKDEFKKWVESDLYNLKIDFEDFHIEE